MYCVPTRGNYFNIVRTNDIKYAIIIIGYLSRDDKSLMYLICLKIFF